MAQTITAPLHGHFITAPDNKVTLADQTATSAVQTLASPCKWFSAIISAKTFGSGSGTVGPIFIIEVGDDSGMSVNVRRVAEAQLTVREAGHSVFLQGCSPDGAKQYARVRVVLSGTDTIAYDAVVAGQP